MFKVFRRGNFDATIKMLRLASSPSFLADLDSFGQRGVDALRQATPVDTGETAAEWYYEIRRSPTSVGIFWMNSHMIGTVPLAVMLQYGHGTRNGGYVQGIDYINPAIKPIFDEIVNAAWATLTK